VNALKRIRRTISLSLHHFSHEAAKPNAAAERPSACDFFHRGTRECTEHLTCRTPTGSLLSQPTQNTEGLRMAELSGDIRNSVKTEAHRNWQKFSTVG
jgi:hypothetical protein